MAIGIFGLDFSQRSQDAKDRNDRKPCMMRPWLLSPTGNRGFPWRHVATLRLCERLRLPRAGAICLSCWVPWIAMPIQEPFAGKESPHPKGYVCYRANTPLRLDGSLEDAAWRAAPWTDDFIDIEGDKKPKPRFRTRAKMLWDDQYLYIGAEMEEPDVWATLTEHDSVIFHDNDFEIFIDPDGDNHLYGEIEINAFGTEWDLLLPKPYKDGGPAINGWEIPGLKVAVRVNGTINDPASSDKGWSVEVGIPWKALGELHRGYADSPSRRPNSSPVPPQHGDQWRINFSRVEWQVEVKDGKYVKKPSTPEDNWVWSEQGVIDMHRPERWGYLQFSTAEPGKDAFKPDPDWPGRDLLHKVYYAQRNHREKTGRCSADLSRITPEVYRSSPFAKSLRIEASANGFEASVPCSDGKGRLTIREDSRIWVVPNR